MELNKILKIFISLGILVGGSKGAFLIEDAYVLSDAILARIAENDTHQFFMANNADWWESFLREIRKLDNGRPQGGMTGLDTNRLSTPQLRADYKRFIMAYDHFYEYRKANNVSQYQHLGVNATIVLGVGVAIFVFRVVYYS